MSPEYRNNVITSLVSLLAETADQLDDSRLVQLQHAVISLVAEFAPSQPPGASVTQADHVVVRNPLSNESKKRGRPSETREGRRPGPRNKKNRHTCGNCGQPGHRQGGSKKKCPAPCKKCKQHGHTILNCPSNNS